MPPKFDPLIEELRRWGIATTGYHAVNDDGPSHGDSVLARQREMGLRSRLKREKEREILGRDGSSRRRFMAKKIAEQSEGKVSMGMVPMWSCDPVPSKNDAGAPRDLPRARVEAFVPDELRWIDRALSALWRESAIRAQVVRIEYTTAGSQRAKVKRIEEQYGASLTLRQYRYELQRGIDFMRGRQAA